MKQTGVNVSIVHPSTQMGHLWVALSEEISRQTKKANLLKVYLQPELLVGSVDIAGVV